MKTPFHKTTLPPAKRAIFLGILMLVLLLPPTQVNAQGPEELKQLLPKTQGVVEEFVEQLSTLRYEEDIVQQKLKGNVHIEYKQDTVYDSLIRMRIEDGQLRVDEQRLVEKGPARPEVRPLLLTSGFSSLAMVFHPYYESSFHFSRLEDETVAGKRFARIHFEHIPGTPSPTLYQMIFAEKPLEISGTAWIDPDTGAIYRIETEVGSTMADMGLKTLRAELTYGSVSLQDEPHPLWLPVSATVDLETPHQHWRNIHHFGDYRKYRVAVKIEAVPTP
jgi:hypothetical protein